MSNGVNKVILLGNAGKDAEVNYLQNNSTVARFTLATNENFKDKEGKKQTRVEWHNVEIWGESAKFVGQYLKKGSLVHVEGKLKTEEFTNKEGQKVRATKIVAFDVQIFNTTKDGSSPAQQVNDYASNGNGAENSKTEFVANMAQGDDLPF